MSGRETARFVAWSFGQDSRMAISPALHFSPTSLADC